MSETIYLSVTLLNVSVEKETTKAILVLLDEKAKKFSGYKFWLPKKLFRNKDWTKKELVLSVPSDFTFHLTKKDGFKVVSDIVLSVNELQEALDNVRVEDRNITLPKTKERYVENDELFSQVKIIDIYSINKFLDTFYYRHNKQTATSLEPLAKEIGISSQTLEQLIYKREKLDRTRLVTLRKIQFYIDKN